MDEHPNIVHDKFPKQGDLLNKDVKVCFNYNPEKSFIGKCIRDDMEPPCLTIFKLNDGRIVLATECMWQYYKYPKPKYTLGDEDA